MFRDHWALDKDLSSPHEVRRLQEAVMWSLILVSMISSAPIDDASAEKFARQFVSDLSTLKLASVSKVLNAQMAAAMPPSKVSELWPQIEMQLGKLKSLDSPAKVSEVGALKTVDLPATFEKSKVTLRVAIDSDEKVAGFFIRPYEAPMSWSPPSYAKADSFTERKLTIGTPPLPAVLSVPKGKGPFPAVILVHGSGPNDKDETVGATKVFKDLAQGLASHGVVVLRYDKRTKVAPEGVKTVKEEVFDAVDAAINVLSTEASVNRILVLGHSQGAYLAPWIARDHPKLSGLVLLAAPARPVMDSVVEQYEYFLKLHPNDEGAKKALEQAKKDRERVNAKDLKPDERIFYAPGEYYLALRGYEPVQVASKLKLPLFIAQGGRDYQVNPSSDFGAYKSALEKNKNVTFKLYQELNHLFVAGEGTSSPEEYAKPGHVDERVVKDLAAWMLR